MGRIQILESCHALLQWAKNAIITAAGVVGALLFERPSAMGRRRGHDEVRNDFGFPITMEASDESSDVSTTSATDQPGSRINERLP